MANTISPEVSAEIRADIAAAREHAELVDAIEGSPLWSKLAIPAYGCCQECGRDTDDRHDGEFLCDECNEELVRGQLEDHRLDDPRHGQAREINAKFWDTP